VKDGFHDPDNSIDKAHAFDFDEGFVASIAGAFAAEKNKAGHILEMDEAVFG
jgi:hypothetical protein